MPAPVAIDLETRHEIDELVAAWESGPERPIDLVFEGGGVLGIGLVGAYDVLYRRGYRPRRLAGTSAGAIVATLVGAGYTPDELYDTIFGLDFRRFMDPTDIVGFPLGGSSAVGMLVAELHDKGLYKGNFFTDELRRLLAPFRIGTFEQLRIADDSAEAQYQHKVQVITADITTRRLLRLPMDASLIGATADALDVVDAVRMSMSIPLFFTPVRRRVGTVEHVLVDGGVLSNFPIWIFDRPTQQLPRWPTFGVRLGSPEQRADVLPAAAAPRTLEIGGFSIPLEAGSFAEFAWALVETMAKFHDRLYLDTHTFARTIGVPTGGLSGTAFDLSDEQKRALFVAGQRAAEDFLARWDFREYILSFRTGAPDAHRTTIVKDWMAERAATGSTSVGV